MCIRDSVTPTADPDLDGDTNPDTNNNADGTLDDGSGFTKEEQEIEVIPNHLTISEKKVSEHKGDDAADEGLKASPDMIREEVGETSINLKIILARAVTDDEAVVFSITGSRGGTRDIHYTASFTDLTIPAGEIEGEATLTLTPFALSLIHISEPTRPY